MNLDSNLLRKQFYFRFDQSQLKLKYLDQLKLSLFYKSSILNLNSTFSIWARTTHFESNHASFLLSYNSLNNFKKIVVIIKFSTIHESTMHSLLKRKEPQ